MNILFSNIFGLIVTLGLIPVVAMADDARGTCSSHGGINCAAGPDFDGSAICNDYWRDSSESYYSALSCRTVTHYCTPEESANFDRKYQVEEKRQIASAISDQMQQIAQSALMESNLSNLTAITSAQLSLKTKYTIAYSDAEDAAAKSIRDCKLLGAQEFQNRFVQLYNFSKTGTEVASNVRNASLSNQSLKIYSDLRSRIALNESMSCAELGITFDPELDMCTRFKNTPFNQRSAWETIERPQAVAQETGDAVKIAQLREQIKQLVLILTKLLAAKNN